MPRGDKSKYTDKQKRKADHIAEGYEERGVSEEEAERRAWATVNKESGGGNKSGSGRGVPDTHESADRWQRLRRRVLSEQPFCAMREKRERCQLVATEVDHIKPHRGDRRLFFDRANLQPMCRSCHAQKTAREVLGKGPGADEHGMPLTPDHWNQEN